MEVVAVQDDFFSGILQTDLTLPSGETKFPIFYRDARMFTLVLPANLIKLRKALPDVRLAPAQVMPGVGAMALTAFEYYDTDIRPYNEFSFGILLNAPYFLALPGYNMLRQYFAQLLNVYIYHLPVTTEIALRAGIDYWNYPKFIAGIDFSDTDSRITCDLSRDGEQILTMSGEKVQARNMGEMKFMCNLYQFRQPQIAEFKVNVVEGSVSWLPGNVSWAFNRSNDIGREISDLIIGNRALMYFYMPKIQCILYGPEYVPIPLMQYVMMTQGFMKDGVSAAKKPAAKKAASKKKAAS